MDGQNSHYNGGDKDAEDLLRNQDKGKKVMQLRPIPDEGNPSPKKVKATSTSSGTALDLDMGLGLGPELNLRLGLPGGSGAQTNLGYGNVGSGSSSSVSIGGFGSGANNGVQSCLSGEVGTYLFGVKISEPGSGANNGAKSCLSGEAGHNLFGQKIGEHWSDIFGARSNAGVRIVESGFGTNYDYGAMRNMWGSTCKIHQCIRCGMTFESDSDLGGHLSKCEDVTGGKYVCKYCCRPFETRYQFGGHVGWCKKAQGGGEDNEAGASGSGSKSYKYNPARGGYVCKDCDMKFDTPNGLRSHMSGGSCKKGEEETLNIKLHVCLYCGQTFRSGPALGGHMSGCKKSQEVEGRWRW